MQPILLCFGVICALVKVISGDADVTIQLLSYSNPTFGLAQDNYYCGYQSPSIPPPPSQRASLQGFSGQQNALGQGQQQQQQQQSLMNQQYGQGQPSQQYPQNQAYQQQYGQNQQNAPPLQGAQYQQYQNQPGQQYPPYGQQQRPRQYQQNQQYAPYGQIPQPQQTQQQQQLLQQQQQQKFQQQQQQPFQQQQQNQQEQAAAQKQRPTEIRAVQQCASQQRDFTVPNWNECRFSFATIFATQGDSPLVISTGLVALPSATGVIDFTNTTWNDRCTWGDCADRTWAAPRIRTFKVKPNIIEVIVTHFGDAAFSSNGGFVSMSNSQARLVDTITINMANLTPAAATVNPPVYSMCANGDQKAATGYPLSSLTLTLSIKCRSGFYGQFCNLTNCTSYNNETHICLSSLYPGQSLACGYDSVNLQPVNCTLCPYGLIDGKCRTYEALVQHEDTYPVGYIIVVTILSFLLLVAIILIIIGCLVYRRDRREPVQRRPRQEAQPSAWGPNFLGTKNRKEKNGKPQGTAAYAAAPTEEPGDTEWQPAQRTPRTPNEQVPPIYSLPNPPARHSPTNTSTPERNGTRREAAV